MQIKYRITLVYTLIVTVILALLCIGIYVSSVQNREILFRKRMVKKAQNTVELLRTKGFDTSMVRKVNEASSSLLYDKSVSVYDDKGQLIFNFTDRYIRPIYLTQQIAARVKTSGIYYFKHGYRDAVCIEYGRTRVKYLVLVAAYDNDRQEWVDFLKLILIASFFLGVTAVIISGYIFSLRLVKSFTTLTNKLNSISTTDFSERLDAGDGKDELQKLTVTINDLLDRLQISFDTQRRFIDNASHELSTPLTAIYSQLDIASQKDRSPEEYKKVLDSVKDDVKGLSLLVRNLLEIAKASGSEKGIELSFVRIDELLMRITADIHRISPLYEVDIVLDVGMEDAADMGTFGNEHLLYSALRNIVHNACKYSSNKKAEVSLAVEGNYILIFIEDNGPGIPPEDLKNIFQPFYRSRKYHNVIAGTGLGLSLAYHIIRLHKGDIIVQSEVGVGSSFKVVLPISPDMSR